MECVYCKFEVTASESGLIIMDGELVHELCAKQSGDLDAEYDSEAALENEAMAAQHLKAEMSIPSILLTDNNGIQCMDCKERFYHNEELVFDGDESKIVTEQYPDWAYARCTNCHERLREAEEESLGYTDSPQAMIDHGYSFNGELNAWVLTREQVTNVYGTPWTPNERELVLAWKKVKRERDALIEEMDREAAHGCHKQMEGMARAYDLLTGKSFDTLVMDPALAIVKEETK